MIFASLKEYFNHSNSAFYSISCKKWSHKFWYRNCNNFSTHSEENNFYFDKKENSLVLDVRFMEMILWIYVQVILPLRFYDEFKHTNLLRILLFKKCYIFSIFLTPYKTDLCLEYFCLWGETLSNKITTIFCKMYTLV